MKELINANDKYKMNWIEGNTEWGTVKCPKGISVNKTSSQSGDIITERYTFKINGLFSKTASKIC